MANPLTSSEDFALLQALPSCRGRYSLNAPLGGVGWFRAGGTADIMFRPADTEDLCEFLSQCPTEIPVTVLGVLSNTIIRDGGMRGVVIRLGREFAMIDQDKNSALRVGGAALDISVARTAADQGLAGLEFLGGIPGTIGGALRMNAGAQGGSPTNGPFGQTSIHDVLIEATAIDRSGRLHKVAGSDLPMTYRHCDAPEDWIFTGALLKTTPDTPDDILARMDALKEKRAAAQPIKARTGGSTFANPKPEELAIAGLPDTTRAWQLVDKVGGRGLRVGGAEISAMHCNFMINTGDATAYDLESLGEDVRRRVYEQFGIILRWEIRRLGDLAIHQPPLASL